MARSNGSSSKRSSLYADLDHLRTMFASVDPANTGYIGFQELKSLAQSGTGMDETMVAVVLEKLDRDKDGKISFDDFQALFESERESIKKQRLEKSYSSCGNERLLESSPLEIVASPPPLEESTEVVLRYKRPFSLQRAEQKHSVDSQLPVLHIGRGPGDGVSPVEHDIATQMQYLTSIPESPRINRASKVLSWISESEDMFEDTGVSEEHTDGLLSPPLSPNRVSADDETHIRSIVEAVCETQDIGPNAVEKLCNHAQADEQEQQELLALVNHLDKEGKGYVSVDEFVGGLHSMCTSASVASSTPPFHCRGKTQKSDMTIPQLSEPFSSTPKSSQRMLAPHTSTPLPIHRKNALQGDAQLTVLDPQNSGFVGVDSLAQQWQKMGVEPPQDQSLEEVLQESLPVDASRRVSVSEVASTLETAVLNENRNYTLRQAAILTFKGEINQLRSQLHQVSMERDGLQSNLQRTTEESKQLVQEGDEQVEKITKESERKARESEQRLSDRLREVEREKEEEAKRLQDLIDMQKERHRRELEGLRKSEERLKIELKFVLDEAKQKNIQGKIELAEGHHSDRPDKVESENSDGFGIRRKLDELEQENADLLEQTKSLQEQNRSLQDRVDELMADNEKLKQKYTSHKRRLQRQHSAPHTSRPDNSKTSRPHSAQRPSSASRKSTTSFPLTRITESPVDTHGVNNFDTDALSSEQENTSEGTILMSEAKKGSDRFSSSSDEGLFAKSTTSLLEEMQSDDAKIFIDKELEELRHAKQELEDNCYLLEAQLRQQQDEGDIEKRKLLSRYRHKQIELKKQIQSLEEQKRRLSLTKDGIENQLEAMGKNLFKQLSDIHKLQHELSSNSMSPNYVTSQQESTKDDEDLQGPLKGPDINYKQKLSVLQHKIDILVSDKQQLLVVHKEAMDKIRSEAEKEKQKVIETEAEHQKKVLRLTTELSSSKMALEHYKNDAQSLEVQLHQLQQEVKAKERELQVFRGKQQRKVFPAVPSENKEYLRLREENESLQKDIQFKSAEMERIPAFHNFHLVKYEAEMEKERQEYQNELQRVTEDAESKISTLKTKMSEQQVLIKMRYNIQLESTQQELKSCQLTMNKLMDRAEEAEKQSEHLLFELSQQRDVVRVKESHIEELQGMQKRCQDEVRSVEKEKQAIELQLREQIKQLCSELQIVKSQLSKTRVVEKVDVPDINCPLEAEVPDTPVMSPSRQSFHSDLTSHAEIISQMKEQLEDLKMCLVQQNSSSMKKNELTLVQELLEANARLKENLEREQRLKELGTLEKDFEIQALAEREKEYHLQGICFNTVKGFEQNLQIFQGESEARICLISEKIKVANATVLSLMEKVKETCIGAHNHEQLAEVSSRPENTTVDLLPKTSQNEQQHLLADESGEINELHEPLFNPPQMEVASRNVQGYPVEMKNVSPCMISVCGDVTDGNVTEGQENEMQQDVHKENMPRQSILVREGNTTIQQEVVNEPVEALMEYMDMASKNDFVVTNVHQDEQLEAEQQTEVEKLEHELDQSRQLIIALEQEEEKRSNVEGQGQNHATVKEQNSATPHQTYWETEALKAQLNSIYSLLGLTSADMDEVDCNNLAQRAEEKIALLFRQVSSEQSLHHEVEVKMNKVQAEWQMQESQWLVEHEEEVRALRQRNLHLSQMLQDTRSQYHDYIAEQERENADILQDLITKQADMQSELELRTKQLSQGSFRGGSPSEQNAEVMLEVLEQLCTQWLTPFDVRDL